jgi:hypothetical protein
MIALNLFNILLLKTILLLNRLALPLGLFFYNHNLSDKGSLVSIGQRDHTAVFPVFSHIALSSCGINVKW